MESRLLLYQEQDLFIQTLLKHWLGKLDGCSKSYIEMSVAKD